MELDEYIDAVRDTLTFWLKIHTDAEAWANEWAGGDFEELYKHSPVVENDYFRFDLREHVAVRIARRDRREYLECPKCMIVYESCCYSQCEGCGRKLRGASIERIAEFLKEVDSLEPDEDIIEDIMIHEAFKVYRNGVRWKVDPIIRDVKDCLRQLRNRRPEKVLEAVTWANHIMHVSGNILKDYCDHSDTDLDYDFVCEVSQEGLAGVFGSEAIEEYLRG